MELFRKYCDTELMIVTRAAECLDDGTPEAAVFLGQCYNELERRNLLDEFCELRFALA